MCLFRHYQVKEVLLAMGIVAVRNHVYGSAMNFQTLLLTLPTPIQDEDRKLTFALVHVKID